MTTELMNNLRRQFLDKVNQCFSSDSEKHAHAEQLLESQLSEDEVKLAKSYDNLSASDRRPRWLMLALSIVMILVWMALVFIPAYRLSKTGGDFVTAIDHMQSIDIDNDYHTWLVQSSYFSDLSEADMLLLFGDYKSATESDRLKGAWESEPGNPGLYIEYVNAYQWDFESYPADMLTVAERIDPGNALFSTLQLAEMADACTKKVDSAESKSTPSISPVLRKGVKHYAITDMTKHQAAMDLFYTIVKMPSFESHTLALLKRRLPLIQRDEQDWLTRWMPIGYLSGMTSHSLRYQKVMMLIKAEAYRCEKEKDAEALKRLIPAWQAFCRMQHPDIVTLVDGMVLRACISGPCEDFAAAAKACGLEELESGFVALGKQMDAENEARYNVPDEISFIKASVFSHLSMGIVAKQVNDRNKLPAPNTGPDRRADHAFFNGLVAALACLMLVLSAMVVWLRTFRRDHLLRILGRRLSATFATRDWVAVFIYGVLLPIGIYWLVNGTDSLLSAQRYTLLNVTPLGQPVSLLLMLLVAPVIAITYRLNHVLPVEQRKVSKCLCSAAVLALLAMPLFGLVGVFMKVWLVILGHSMQILACVLVLAALVGSYRRNKKEGGGSLFRAVRSQLLVPLYVSASLIMALHVSIYYGIEKHWVAEDELWKLSGDTIGPSSFEAVVTRQLSDELDELLKQIESDFPSDPVNK